VNARLNNSPFISRKLTESGLFSISQFLVEVHVVMNEEMKLKETHDVSELLQKKLESLTEVERAFVHVDFNFDHNPSDEHVRKQL
jgi:divalent metal cation (Fe/Co/Zn/Cd) transporter